MGISSPVTIVGLSQSNSYIQIPNEPINFEEYLDSAAYSYFSGMMTDAEPDEGAIPAQGRTYSVSLPGPRNLTGGAYYDYLDITFANMSSAASNGMKLFVKENNPYVPAGATTSAAVTQNIATGWLSAAIDIPAATNTDSPTFKTIRFNIGNAIVGANDMIFKFYVPALSAAKYARTYTTDGAEAYLKKSMLRSLSKYSFQNLGLPTDWRIGLAYANADYIANQADATNSGNWTYANGDSFTFYDSPNPSSIPWMLVKWHQVGTSAKKTVEMVGDSIMQGYGDNNEILSVEGITRRLNLNNTSQNTNRFFINLGQSGSTPEQYLARWEGIAKTTSATAMAYSIYSPNGFFDGGLIIPSRIQDMKDNCILAETKAAQYGRVFIPCFITNTNLYQLNQLPASAAAQNVTFHVKDLYDWAIARYGNRLWNLQPAVNDTTNTIGINMASEYTDDQTHPNIAGIDALGALAISTFDDVYANCLAYSLA